MRCEIFTYFGISCLFKVFMLTLRAHQPPMHKENQKSDSWNSLTQKLHRKNFVNDDESNRSAFSVYFSLHRLYTFVPSLVHILSFFFLRLRKVRIRTNKSQHNIALDSIKIYLWFYSNLCKAFCVYIVCTLYSVTFYSNEPVSFSSNERSRSHARYSWEW